MQEKKKLERFNTGFQDHLVLFDSNFLPLTTFKIQSQMLPFLFLAIMSLPFFPVHLIKTKNQRENHVY